MMNQTSLRSGARSSWLPAVLGILVGLAVVLMLVIPAGALGVVTIGFCLALAVVLSLTVAGHQRAKLVVLALLAVLTVIAAVAAVAA